MKKSLLTVLVAAGIGAGLWPARPMASAAMAAKASLVLGGGQLQTDDPARP